jgi:hypothetical protein
MNARAIAALSVLALLTAAFAPLPTLADNNVVSYDLATRQFDPMSAGEYDGRLRMNITPDGIVNGTFLTDDGELSNVTGGLHGKKIWLQIGDHTAIERTFTGTFVDSKLTATAMGRGLHSWTLEGTPTTH